MRIGIVSPEFPPDIGGVETYAYEVTKELIRRGHEVTVFTRPHLGGADTDPRIEMLPELTQQYEVDRLLPKKHAMDVWHVMNASYAWLALETPEVVVSVHGNDFISPYFLPMAPPLPRMLGLWRLESHFAVPRRRLWRKAAQRLMWRGLRRARQVIANSKFTMNLLISHAPLCVANTSVGIVGVGEEFLRVERRHCGANPAKRLVTVCRLAEPRKNVDKILRALARLKHYPFEFTVIGDGKLRHGLESLCHQLALSDRVNFTGSIDTSEIQRRLMSADLFVLTSELLPDSVEGFGIAYLEANACGTPVLAARSGGAVEAVEEGRSGYFVEETSIEAITAGLQRFLAGEVTFDSANCRAFANRFTWARVVDHACRFYPDGNGHAAARRSVSSSR